MTACRGTGCLHGQHTPQQRCWHMQGVAVSYVSTHSWCNIVCWLCPMYGACSRRAVWLHGFCLC